MKEILLNEIYRPKNLNELILPDRIKDVFKGIIEKNEIPNLVFSGTSGLGKTSSAMILVKSIGGDYLFKNASLTGNIDTLRNEIQNFASSISFDNERKCVIFDEAENITPQTQLALKALIEDTSAITSYIFTCNDIRRLIPALQSRLVTIDFNLLVDEKRPMMEKYYYRIIEILNAENIKFDKKVVGEVLKKNFPDFRKILNLIQTYSTVGIVTESGILSDVKKDYSDVINILKEKSFDLLRNWASENVDASNSLDKLYNIILPYIKNSDKPNLAIHTSEYMYKANFSIDLEILLTAYLCEIMLTLSFE